MESYSRIERHGSAAVEVGTVVHDGRGYAALGSIDDPERGVLVGYVTEREGCYWLTTWSGDRIARFVLRRTWKAWFAGQRVTMYAWRCELHGRVYSGRNGGFFGGPGCLVRMRAGRWLT